MPKSVEEAVRLATQQEAVETAQKRLCKQETSVEKETSTRIDGDFNEIAAVVKRGEEDMTVERLRRQVQESENSCNSKRGSSKGPCADDRRRRRVQWIQ